MEKTEKLEKIVPDTSIIIENLLSEKIGKKEISVNEVIIHEAVLAELEHQANLGRTIGLLGLDELKKLKDLSDKGLFKIEYKGRRPTAVEIKNASLGEIDALIRELAYTEDAVLITGDKVQSKVGEAKGMKVMYIEPVIKKRKLKLEKYFDKTTMSVHLRENLKPYAKKGMPGNWKFLSLDDKEMQQEDIVDIAKEIIEEAKMRKDAFLEIERRGSTVVQLGDYRIVITRPPFSDAYEITAVKPIKKMNLEDYKLSDKLKLRIEKQAEGILIAGSPGEGKSTFCSSLAEFYASKGRIVKTIESPRDLQLSENITQYSITHGSAQEIHDVLLLSRPDYTLFDEMRNFEDFRLFSDLRLSGIGLAGVLHAKNPIDAIQRFIGKTELGVIPQIIDTVIFIKDGFVNKVLNLQMVVKVPSGMVEEDLARPVVEVRDFENNKLEFEIYSYGEETVVIPVNIEKKSASKELASRHIENELRKFIPNVKAELISESKANIYVPESEIGKVIGKDGKNIEAIEKKLGLHINVEPLYESKGKEDISYNLNEKSNVIIFYVDNSLRGKEIDIFSDDTYLFSARIGKKGELKINKRSKTGQEIMKSFDSNKKVSLRI
ncbi:MAG: PINc/VapC family ATPase [archaeon]